MKQHIYIKLIALFLGFNYFQTSAQISFAHYFVDSIDSWPSVVAIGDVNHDGRNDVVLGTSSYNNPQIDLHILVFLQDSTGHLLSPVLYRYSHTYSIKSISIGDVNNDNLNDVVVGFNDSIGIFYQNNAGALNPIVRYYSGNTVSSVRVGDVNQDGLMDIAVAHISSPHISLFKQINGGFHLDTLASLAHEKQVEIADVTGDGVNDLIVLESTTILPHLQVFKQINSGTFNPYVSYAVDSEGFFNPVNSIAVGDVNNDGFNDVVGTRSGNSPNCKLIFWYQDSASHLLHSPVELPSYDIPEAVKIDNLNCEGANEIILAHGGWEAVTVFSRDSANVYNGYHHFIIPYASHYAIDGMSVGDINSDGRKDIVIADTNNGLDVLLNNSQPTTMTIIDSFSSVHHLSTDTFPNGNYYYTVADTQISGNQLVVTDYTFIVNQHAIVDSTEIDSALVETGSICGLVVNDTMNSVNYILNYAYISDTAFFDSSVHVVTTGLNDFISDQLYVYPNPFNEVIFIESASVFTEPRKISISDVSGREMISFSSAASKASVNCDFLPAGAYLLQVSNRSGTLRKCIVKR